jgi:hypothetical protein
MIALQEGVPVLPCGVYSFGWSLGNRMSCAVVWGERSSSRGSPARDTATGAAELVGAEILRLWRQAAESVAAGFPAELPDGALRAGPAYRPLRAPTMASPSTSVKKAAA